MYAYKRRDGSTYYRPVLRTVVTDAAGNKKTEHVPMSVLKPHLDGTRESAQRLVAYWKATLLGRLDG